MLALFPTTHITLVQQFPIDDMFFLFFYIYFLFSSFLFFSPSFVFCLYSDQRHEQSADIADGIFQCPRPWVSEHSQSLCFCAFFLSPILHLVVSTQFENLMTMKHLSTKSVDIVPSVLGWYPLQPWTHGKALQHIQWFIRIQLARCSWQWVSIRNGIISRTKFGAIQTRISVPGTSWKWVVRARTSCTGKSGERNK